MSNEPQKEPGAFSRALAKARSARARTITIGVILLLAAAFFVYFGSYSHLDDTARAALVSDETVTVTQTDYGWFFDGPAYTDALIFYPGAKVEEGAYAPMLRLIAQDKADVFLVKMPFHFSLFGIRKASAIMKRYDYMRWYLGGHSVGGAAAALYTHRHPNHISGLFLCAAYPVRPLDHMLNVVTVYGDRDGVLNRKRLEKGQQYVNDSSTEWVIEGGNHAQFGSYGPQRGDGEAAISPEEQWAQAAEAFQYLLDLNNGVMTY